MLCGCHYQRYHYCIDFRIARKEYHTGFKNLMSQTNQAGRNEQYPSGSVAPGAAHPQTEPAGGNKVVQEGSVRSATESTIERLGTQPISSLLWGTSIPYLITNLLNAVAYFSDYNIAIFYTGLEGLRAQSILYGSDLLFVIVPCQAFAGVAVNMLSPALAANKVIMANVIFSHYVLVSMFWAVLICAIMVPLGHRFLSGVDLTWGTEFGSYYKIMFGLGVFLTPFSIGFGNFLAAENRCFLNIMRSLALSILFVLFDQLYYFYFKMIYPEGTFILHASAWSFVTAHSLVAVWMIFIMFRKSILDMPLKGVLKLNLGVFYKYPCCYKKLNPFVFNWKLFLGMLLGALGPYFGIARLGMLLINTNTSLGKYYTSEYKLQLSRASYLTYARFYDLYGSVTDAFIKGFSAVVSYNIATKRYGRASEIMMATALWSTVLTGALAAVSLVFQKQLISFLQPNMENVLSAEDYLIFQSYLPSLQKFFQMAVLSCIWMSPYYIVIILSTIEKKRAISILLSMTRTIASMVMVSITSSLIQDDVDCSFILALGEGIVGALGIIFFIYYILKYKYFAAVEEYRILTRSLDAQLGLIEDLEKDKPNSDITSKMQESTMVTELAESIRNVSFDEMPMTARSGMSAASVKTYNTLSSTRRLMHIRQDLLNNQARSRPVSGLSSHSYASRLTRNTMAQITLAIPEDREGIVYNDEDEEIGSDINQPDWDQLRKAYREELDNELDDLINFEKKKQKLSAEERKAARIQRRMEAMNKRERPRISSTPRTSRPSRQSSAQSKSSILD
ncbi:DinF protein/ transporter [Giardia duodenalis assemblage B]|uniref:DinF protein/ transporter n=1 Tax=Giardia duodenalis assemblage B TaxID=1394984 RepID=A0A132NPG7_GIAIN|nr:DinF protein/ transporter [Giardia intestinalis assemblage B]